MCSVENIGTLWKVSSTQLARRGTHFLWNAQPLNDYPIHKWADYVIKNDLKSDRLPTVGD